MKKGVLSYCFAFSSTSYSIAVLHTFTPFPSPVEPLKIIITKKFDNLRINKKNKERKNYTQGEIAKEVNDALIEALTDDYQQFIGAHVKYKDYAVKKNHYLNRIREKLTPILLKVRRNYGSNYLGKVEEKNYYRNALLDREQKQLHFKEIN